MRPPVIIVSLVHIQGPLKGDIQELSQETIRIGRHRSNDVRFPADLTIVSRNHAEIVREGNRFRLIDKSVNGTYVNGKRITDAFLKDGDVIEFADGGPKASFLTQMREDQAEQSSPRVEAPPVQVPPTPQPIRPEPVPRAFMSSMEETPPRPHAGILLQDQVNAPQPRTGDEIVIQPAAAPLVIQFGPTVRSYKQLPVTMGRHPKCDFVLDESGILDQHVQIFHFQNRYWVKDLTGQGLVRVNQRPIASPTALTVNDAFALTPKGPAFRFVGEGRLAEDSSLEAADEALQGDNRASLGPRPEAAFPDRPKDGIFSKVKKKLF